MHNSDESCRGNATACLIVIARRENAVSHAVVPDKRAPCGAQRRQVASAIRDPYNHRTLMSPRLSPRRALPKDSAVEIPAPAGRQLLLVHAGLKD